MDLPAKNQEKPLWQQVADEVIGGIRSSRYPVGSQLPTEEQLKKMYSCSRHTVRTALSHLANEGYIERHPRTGTTVINNGTALKLGAFFDTAEKLLPAVKNPVFKLVSTSVITADANLARRILVRPGEGLVRIDYVQLSIGEQWLPVAHLGYYTRIANTDFVDVCRAHPDIPLENLLSKVLSRPYFRVETSYGICLTSDEAARYLSQKAGEPSLEILRRFTDSSNRFLLACISQHAAELKLEFSITAGNF